MKRYRAFEVNDEGVLTGEPIIILAGDDFEAIVRAMDVAKTRGLEVWDEDQRIGIIQALSGDD